MLAFLLSLSSHLVVVATVLAVAALVWLAALWAWSETHIRGRSKLRKLAISFVVGVPLALIAVAVTQYQIVQSYCPPRAMFARVFGVAPPASVHNLKSEFDEFGDIASLLLQFQTDAQTVKAVTRTGYRPLTGAARKQFQPVTAFDKPT